MKFAEHIACTINEALKLTLGCGDVQMLGVARLVKREAEDGKMEVWPAIFPEGQEPVYAGPDDRYSITAYHRAVAMSTTRIPGGYGDSNGKIKVSHRMSLVLFADREKTKVDPDELAMFAHMAFPHTLRKDQRPIDIETVTININDVVLSEEQVFNEEFKNVKYFIGPEQLLIKVNYTIESTIARPCFNKTCQ